MKALVLAAGRGTRMNKLTDNTPKPLLAVNGKRFIDFVMKNLSEAGIAEVGVVVGYMKEKVIESLRGNELKTTFIEQEEQLGTGHAIMMAKEWAGNDDFIVLMGDNLYSPRDIMNISREDGFCYVAGYRHETPEKFGVLVTKGEMLDGIIEKPSSPPSNLINTGLYKFTPDIFDALAMIEKSERGEYEVTDAISMLCKKQKVKFIRLDDYWLNLGCPEDMPAISDFLSKLPGHGQP